MSHNSTDQTVARTTETDTNKIFLYELATCRAENYLLMEKMAECHGIVQSLKQMMASVTENLAEIHNDVLELRKCVISLHTKVADSSTSTAEGYLQDSDTEEVPSSYISPQASSESGSEPETEIIATPMEQYDLATKTMPAWSILYSIQEEVEPEDSQEDVIDYQNEPEKDEPEPKNQPKQEDKPEQEAEPGQKQEDSQPLEEDISAAKGDN